MAQTPLESLSALTAALELEASPAELEQALPQVTRFLRSALSREPLTDLGEIEPSFGLRFDATEGVGDGSS